MILPGSAGKYTPDEAVCEVEQTKRSKPRLEYELNETVRVKEGPFADFSGEIGTQKPLGFWDPLGFTKDAGQEQFDRVRNQARTCFHARVRRIPRDVHRRACTGRR